MERLGFPTRLRATLRNAYHAEDAHRRYKVAGRLGRKEQIAANRGLIQGCAISAAMMTVCTIPWARWVRDGLTVADDGDGADLRQGIEPVLRAHVGDQWQGDEWDLMAEPANNLTFGGYIDDIHVASTDARQVRRAHLLTLVWAEAMQVELSTTKSKAWGGMHLRIRGTTLAQDDAGELLGEEVKAQAGSGKMS